MEFANQYGINLPAIDQAVSAKKTAEQNIKMNDMKMNALTKEQDRQDQIESADTNIKNELYPKSKAVTLQQAKEEEAVTHAQKEYQLKQNMIAHQQVASHIAQLINQPDNIKIPTVQNNLKQLQATNPEQFAYTMNKMPFKGDINDPNYVAQIIPYMAKDVFDDATKAQHDYEEHKAEIAHKNKISEINALYGNKKEINQDTIEGRLKAVEIGVKGRKELAKYKEQHGGGKPTVLEMKAAALVDGGQAKDMNEAIRLVMAPTKTTNVDDPIYGKKTVVSNTTYGNGLKPPPALVKVNSRDQAVRAIKTKYPNATQQQIDSYLKSKGL